MIKKFLAIFTLICFTGTLTPAAQLYMMESTQFTSVKSDIENAFLANGYTLSNKNPYLGKNGAKVVTAIFRQDGSRLYYYYGGDTSEAVNKSFLATLKTKGRSCVKSKDFAGDYKNISDNLKSLQVVKEQGKDVFTFSDAGEEKSFTLNSSRSKAKKSDEALTGYVGTVDKGTIVKVYLQQPLDTATAKTGDEVVAVLPSDWVYNGTVIAPQGSYVFGTVTGGHCATYGYRGGRAEINFTRVETPEGKTFDISVEKTIFASEEEGVAKDVAGKVAAGALFGVIGGLVALLFGDTSSAAKYIAIGAVSGATMGAVTSAAQKGTDVEIPAYTEFELTLKRPLKAVFGN